MEVLVKYLTNSQHRAQACGSQLEESYRNAIDRKPFAFSTTWSVQYHFLSSLR